MNQNSSTNGVVRGLAAAVGGATAYSAHDEWIQAFGAFVTLLSIVWSIVEKTRAAKTAAQNQTNPTQTNP